MSITVEAEGAITLTEELATRSQDLSPVLEVVAADLKTFVDNRFRTSTDPTGEQWPPLAESTVRNRRRGSRKPLIDTSDLRNSISAQIEALAIRIGSNVDYAGFHQFGTVNIPMRAYLPFDEDGNLMDEGAAAEEFDRYAEMIATYIETGEITG